MRRGLPAHRRAKGVDEEVDAILKRMPELKRPKYLVLNKIDLIAREKLLALAASLNERVPFERIFMISALTGDGVDDLRRELAADAAEPLALSRGPGLRRAPAMLAAEITREKIYDRLHEELPYSSTVETDQWQVRPDGSVRIEQTSSSSARANGRSCWARAQTIKAIGQAARSRSPRRRRRRSTCSCS